LTNTRALSRFASRLVGEDLRDHNPKLLGVSGGKPSDGEVGNDVLSVDRSASGVEDGPEIGGLEQERRNLIFDSGLQVVLEVVGGVAQEQDVAKPQAPPVMVGVGEEFPDGLGPLLSESELGG
jgi:hypothetical protein